MNLNKLFPRLPIAWKLAIAFVAIAGVPLGVVGVVGTHAALEELRRAALEDLHHEMDLAALRTARALREVGQHVAFLDSLGLGRSVLEGRGDTGETARLARTYLQADSSALFRVKLIDGMGYSAGTITADAHHHESSEDARPELLYLMVAENLAPGDMTYLPVELRADGDGGPSILAAVAIVRPVFSGRTFLGAVVGEADAALLFDGLDLAPPGLSGVTGLVDGEGRYLFHSDLKRDWASLGDGVAGSLDDEFPPEVTERILAGDSVLEAPGGVEIAVRRLTAAGMPWGTLTLYRTVPMSALYARVGSFLGLITAVGTGLVVLVALLSGVAARQITRPILRLQQAAHTLAAGAPATPLQVDTNDEIEDLARDFNHMATMLARHRGDMEALVAQRTEALRQAQAQLAQLVTSSADAIIGTDPDELVILWNEGAESLFGYAERDALGHQLGDLITPSDGRNAAELQYLRRALEENGCVVNYRTRRRTRDGSALPVTLTMTALRDPGGETVGYSIIIRDDRARELLEDQMRRSERLAAISIMAAGLAHELNNPLSVLGNRIELMQREAMTRNGDRHFLRDLDVLRKHVGRIGSITGDLLRFARADDDALTQVSVNEVVLRVVRLTHRVFVAADLELTTDLARDLPAALGNENIVETILVNLLLNAKHATPKGGRVEVVTRTGPSSAVEIEVRDTGPGVPPDLRRRIFEPFFTTRASDGGTGLGLAVCRALVDRMGGTLDIDDWAGGGASFLVRLQQDANEAVPV